jgi:hypothetical protein
MLIPLNTLFIKNYDIQRFIYYFQIFSLFIRIIKWYFFEEVKVIYINV